ncbi:MAG: chorismate synthase [Lachnospiraceae bacterium]|nr:chorismate synthase [Lachnospiraceae bacterium]
MAGSTYGTNFRITTWGESHGTALGAVIDGCPAGLKINEEYIQAFLNRRKPGQSKYTTARAEGDEVEILSGVFEGRTTGTPISLMVRNTDHHSADYSEIASYYRPGHADLTFDEKYGFRDYRGGGRSSGRETIGRVAAGAVAIKLLEELNIKVLTYTKSVGSINVDTDKFDIEEINNNPLYMPDAQAAKKACDFLDDLKKKGDSAGGCVECRITGMPAGVGEPVFDKLDAALAKALMSIGAVKAVEIGDGITAAGSTGSNNNDAFHTQDGRIVKMTNHSGGILGGMSDGSEIILRAHIKPTPSISMEQETVNKGGQDIRINIKGRHDPIIVPRAVVVVESMAAITLADLLMINMSARMDNLKKIYLF